MQRPTFRAGDQVRHRPTGEDWLIAAVLPNGTDVMPYGWPATIAKAADCTLLKDASDEEHHTALEELARGEGNDLRRVLARDALRRLAAPAEAR